MQVYDCIIIGGGPAGLNAAVVLGRCRRSVLVFDTGMYRNRYSHGIHNFLTRDDIDPKVFLQHCHAELEKYSVQMLSKKIVKATKNNEGLFLAKADDGSSYAAKKMLVATGLTDNLPPIDGFEEMYGRSVFHCPYCDGWEVRDKNIGVYAKNKNGWELALALTGWSNDVTLYTDGKNYLKPYQANQLQACGVAVNNKKISRLAGHEGHIEKLVFQNGEESPCQALFFVNGFTQQCNLAETFGCKMSRKGVVLTTRYQQTDIPGLYVAGDAAKDMHFVVVAAAEGAKAAVIINKELQKEAIELKMAQLQQAAHL